MNSDFTDHHCASLTAFLYTYWPADFTDHNSALLTAFFVHLLTYWSQFRFTDRIFVHLLTSSTLHQLYQSQFRIFAHLLTCWLYWCTIPLYWPHLLYTCWLTDHHCALLTAFLYTYWPHQSQLCFTVLHTYLTRSLFTDRIFRTLTNCWPADFTDDNFALPTAFLHTDWPADFTDHTILLHWPHFFCTLIIDQLYILSLLAFHRPLYWLFWFSNLTLLNKGNVWVQTSKQNTGCASASLYKNAGQNHSTQDSRVVPHRGTN